MESLLLDLRYAVRSLVKSPGFTAVAVLTLALGIGANMAMFSVADSVLFARLPFRDPDRVLSVNLRQPNGNPNIFSTPDFLEWRQNSTLLAHMGAFVPRSANLAALGEVPEHIDGGNASSEIFGVLGVPPRFGRVFTSSEDQPNGAAVVVLSHGLWQSRFQSDASIVGKTISLDGAPHTILGVMPAGFHVLADTELFWTPLRLPLTAPNDSARNVHWLFALARLPSSMPIQRAQAQLDAIATRVARERPDREGTGVSLQTYRDAQTGSIRPALLMLLGSVGFVLLIACSNIANLLLARGTGRRRELSVRAALGARRSRLVRQLLTETAVLGIAGGALGIVFGWSALKIMASLIPSTFGIHRVSLDTPVLAAGIVLALFVGLLFGVAPSLSASRVDLNRDLRGGTRGTGHLGRHRAILLVSETALACVLLIGAGLTMKTLWKLGQVPLGFRPDHVVTFRISAPANASNNGIDFYHQVLDRMRSLTVIESVGMARDLPMSGTDPSVPIAVASGAQPLDTSVARYRAIAPGYFPTLGIPLLRGRDISPSDTAGSPSVVIISQSLAREYWPNQDPIGQQIQPKIPGAQPTVVIGIAGDVRHWSRDLALQPTAYYPVAQVPVAVRPLVLSYMSFALRTHIAPEALLPLVRAAAAGVDKTAPIYDVRTMDSLVADSSSLRRFDLSLLATFAGLALALAAVGVYGVMAYSVTQRTGEIGIRVALGASRADVQRLIVSHAARLGAIGVALGVIAAFALARVLAAVVYGVSPHDGTTFSIAAGFVMAAILLAGYLPARRATRIEPLVALRAE